MRRMPNLNLQKADLQHAGVPKETLAVVPFWGQLTITLEGVTPRAAAALPVTPFQITQFPFRIGRLSTDPLIYNDLMITDSVPLQISRHHLAFIAYEDRIGVVDRGSRLGSWVDGQKLGGPSGPSGPLFPTGSEGLLVLGNRDSQFRYPVASASDQLDHAPGSFNKLLNKYHEDTKMRRTTRNPTVGCRERAALARRHMRPFILCCLICYG